MVLRIFVEKYLHVCGQKPKYISNITHPLHQGTKDRNIRLIFRKSEHLTTFIIIDYFQYDGLIKWKLEWQNSNLFISHV